MIVLSEILASASSAELQIAILKNHIGIIDRLSVINHAELIKNRDEFRTLSLKANLFAGLDYEVAENISTLNAILNTAIRVSDTFVFQRFYSILKSKQLYTSPLIEASSLFMLDVSTCHDLLSRFDSLIEKLEFAYSETEDNDKNVISVLTHYYLFFIKNFIEFATEDVAKAKDRIRGAYENESIRFTKGDFIRSILSFEIKAEQSPFEQISHLLDQFLGRAECVKPIEISYLFEDGTPYQTQLGEPPYTIEHILGVNAKQYLPIKDDSVYYSLQRGVKILDREIELLCYMYAFGRMHKAKLDDTFNHIPDKIKSYRIIDWGCGQGIGSLMFLEKIDASGHENICNEVILIEPSAIALKRAALHLQGRCKNIQTINKCLDTLNPSDFSAPKGVSTIHVFSNILDVELFSIGKLIELIEEISPGKNYFFISSPRIDDSRTGRINAFVKHFEEHNDYKLHYSSTLAKDCWKCGWSKVIRVFEADI